MGSWQSRPVILPSCLDTNLSIGTYVTIIDIGGEIKTGNTCFAMQLAHPPGLFGPYYAMYYSLCNSTSKHLIPLIILHIIKYYLVPNKAPTFYY
jgi:hypothetical protein